MKFLYDWVKNIIYFYIFMTAVLHLLPKNSYEKYVRFFGGLLLTIILISPVLELVFDENYLLDKISYASFWQEMDTMKLDVEKMEEAQKKTFISEYEKTIENDIELLISEYNFYAVYVDVTLNEEYLVETIKMSISTKEPGEIYIEKIALEDNDITAPEIGKLKEKLSEFYQVKSEQIQIAVQEE